MNKEIERMKMVKAMEYIVRQVNDEDIFMGWLYTGVADGDIEYGDLEVTGEDFDNLGWYIEDEHFASLMNLFLRIMAKAKADGLYCGKVLSE